MRNNSSDRFSRPYISDTLPVFIYFTDRRSLSALVHCNGAAADGLRLSAARGRNQPSSSAPFHSRVLRIEQNENGRRTHQSADDPEEEAIEEDT